MWRMRHIVGYTYKVGEINCGTSADNLAIDQLEAVSFKAPSGVITTDVAWPSNQHTSSNTTTTSTQKPARSQDFALCSTSDLLGQGTGYAVMEYIDLTSSTTPDRTTEALRWLSKVTVPLDHVGIASPGKWSFPLSFSNIVALERYLNRVHLRLCFLEHSPSANT